ncbi:ubiquitin carboxyl-terminal hydrolase 36-like [Oppia nitens]|uniref:ubiquitin carboxyl-terminal hydrolase 36-like n=1 Tax=Oppia nitens TaxID=1686743 RepID=UPI0023DC1BAB|nr:ubiquitin carboxyl-terminal hydrolase 36-like [Oppia nitens]
MMGSLIEDNSFNINNQITSGSRSSILSSHVDFVANDDDDDDIMSTKTLQNKYNVLTNDNNLVNNNNNHTMSTNNNNNNKLNNELVIKMNGQNKSSNFSPNFNLMNGSDNCNNTSDGIPVPKHVLYPRENIILEWKEPHRIGAGLSNLGNTCFLNSVLQCLSYCPPLVNYLLHTNDHNQNKCNINNTFCMVCEMIRHIRQSRIHSDKVIKPINICRRLKSIAKHFQFGRQEDAHEFLRYVIDNMWKSCLNNKDTANSKLDPLSKETTAINQIFGGYHRSQVICLECKAKSNTYDYFMDFMLDIKNVSSLEKALDKYVTPELLQHENAYKCTRCKKRVLAKKQFTVFRAPNVATFQLKRFDYNRIFGGKITKPITYPEKLNLRPYMSENKGPPILYKLNSVLVHMGPTCNSGHYFCYVRNSNNSWYLMDDSRIVQVNQNQALNQQAYVLFYVRVDTDFHKPAPVNKFVSQITPNGIKLSKVIIPEVTNNCNQKFKDDFNSPKNVSPNVTQTQNGIKSPQTQKNHFLSTKPTINIKLGGQTLKNSIIPVQNQKHFIGPQCEPKTSNKQLDPTKDMTALNGKHSNSKSNSKGLVPYSSDSSDDDSYKSTTFYLKSSSGTLSVTANNVDKDKEKIKEIESDVNVNGFLQSNNNRVFGDKVKSWNGGLSSIDCSLNDEKRKLDESNDDYDNEFDRGKTKKIKTKHPEKYYESGINPFQKHQTEMQRFNGSFKTNGYNDRQFNGDNNINDNKYITTNTEEDVDFKSDTSAKQEKCGENIDKNNNISEGLDKFSKTSEQFDKSINKVEEIVDKFHKSNENGEKYQKSENFNEKHLKSNGFNDKQQKIDSYSDRYFKSNGYLNKYPKSEHFDRHYKFNGHFDNNNKHFKFSNNNNNYNYNMHYKNNRHSDNYNKTNGNFDKYHKNNGNFYRHNKNKKHFHPQHHKNKKHFYRQYK